MHTPEREALIKIGIKKYWDNLKRMREWFDKGLIDIQSNDLLEEMKTFVAEDNGAFNAVVGSHDDLVSACWLCIAGMKSAFWYPF